VNQLSTVKAFGTVLLMMVPGLAPGITATPTGQTDDGPAPMLPYPGLVTRLAREDKPLPPFITDPDSNDAYGVTWTQAPAAVMGAPVITTVESAAGRVYLPLILRNQPPVSTASTTG
jgi:hypothetical protein